MPKWSEIPIKIRRFSRRRIFLKKIAKNTKIVLTFVFENVIIIKLSIRQALFFGGVAQLVERLPCKQEVTGSNPIISTKNEGS